MLYVSFIREGDVYHKLCFLNHDVYTEITVIFTSTHRHTLYIYIYI